MLKDEAENIHSMLNRYSPKPDIVAVNINNTTDNTKQVLTDYCKKYNIKLYIIESKFYNYAENRNIVTEFVYSAIRSYYGLPSTGPLSKDELLTMDKNDDVWYSHMVDADNLTLDDKVTYNDNLTDEELGSVNFVKCINMSLPNNSKGGKKEYPDSFDMTILSGSKYVVNNTFRIHLNGYNSIIYLCPIHEVATPKCWNMITFDLKGCYIKRGQKGARSRDSQTYMKDALTISSYLSNGRIVPGDIPRMTYYCAQSFRDSRLYTESIEYFRMRTNMTEGYLDERFMAYLNLNQLISFIRIDGDSPYSKDELELKKMEYLANAHELIPYRWDALVPLFKFYYSRKLYKIAWNIAKPYARMYNVPKGLFVDKSYYESISVLEDFALCAHHAGDNDTSREILNHIGALPQTKFKDGEYSRIMGHKALLK